MSCQQRWTSTWPAMQVVICALLGFAVFMLSCVSSGRSTNVDFNKWIDKLIESSQEPALASSRQIGVNNYSIGWQSVESVVTKIILYRGQSYAEPEVVGHDYAGLKEALRQLPSGSFVSYTFSDYREDLLNFQQIKELHDLCENNSVRFLLFEGG